MLTLQHLNATSDLELLLGPREADIMRLLWSRGSATVRELHQWIVTDPPLAYTTIMTTCVRLTTKGLLERHPVTQRGERPRKTQAYLYTPRISEQEFASSAIGQHIGPLLSHYPAIVEAHVTGLPTTRDLNASTDRPRVEHLLAYLGMLHDRSGQRIEDMALDTIAALLERAERAERTAATKTANLERAEQRSELAERRAEAAEQRAQTAERRAQRAERRAAALQKKLDNLKPQKRAYSTTPIHEYRGNICRVCGCQAPPQPAFRQDNLRVCTNIDCRKEARRRDNLAKQHRFRQRQRAQLAQVQQA